jgi:beta-barrel assembly-enhancing protease
MKYVQKLPDDTVNITKNNPVVEFLKMVTGIFVITVAVIFIITIATELLSPYIPVKVEKKLGSFISASMCAVKMEEEVKELETILEKFRPYFSIKDKRLDYRICVLPDDTFNAAALPGGTIVFYKGLLDAMPDEHEKAFILAHELGHFHYRDHNKRLGSAFIYLVMSTIFGAFDSGAAQTVSAHTASFMFNKFSQKQEKKADLFALEMVKLAYGKPDGAIKAAEKLIKFNKLNKFQHYFSTHPHPENRLEYIKEAAGGKPSFL